MRNWRIYLVLITALLALLTLAACPAPKQGDANGTPASTPATSGSPTGDSNSSGQPATDPPPATDPAGSTDTGTAGENGTATTNSAVELVGDWFALFGRHDGGVSEPTFDNGHQIRIFPRGKGEIVMFAAGKPVMTLPLIWEDKGDAIMISYVPFEAVKSGLTRVAPIGIAEEEEIGLLKAEEAGESSIDRDEEIGLLKDEGKGMTTGGKPGQSVTKLIKFKVEQNFLSLTDQYSRLMVYGRVPSAEAQPIEPDFSGSWVGHIDMHDNFPATFNWDGKTLTIKYEHDGGMFTGRLEQGYFVGQIKGGRAPARAALKITASYNLDGAYLADPYVEMNDRFDFNHAGD